MILARGDIFTFDKVDEVGHLVVDSTFHGYVFFARVLWDGQDSNWTMC